MVEEYEQASPPMADVDIWRAAHQMMQLYAEGALWRATLRADALLDQGDTQGFFAWKRIARAIDDLGRGPRAGEIRN